MMPITPALDRVRLLAGSLQSRFSLDRDSRRVLIWREPGSQYRLSNIVKKNHCGRDGPMVWAGIMADGHTNLYLFDRDTLIDQRSLDEILAPYARLSHGAYKPNFIFMDDNARPHRTQLEDEYLHLVDIQSLKWPAMFPDLNTIEH
ncbi:transposable element Tc1 transposase [Trichonephila clavipes]|nr:transposable element Tc1 transposase [Trichonephila clavipes]